MRWAVVDTPIGPVTVGAVGDAVRAVRLPRPRTSPADGVAPAAAHAPVVRPGAEDRYGEPALDESVLDAAVRQLRAYFTGERTGFSLSTALAPEHGSEFERAVWTELTRIPYGQTHTYGQVAAAVGDPGAARAVGTACNRNPLPLLVPCHRVVGAGGKLVGFGGGLASKRWLLEHEARILMEQTWR